MEGYISRQRPQVPRGNQDKDRGGIFFDPHAQVAKQVPNSNDDVPMPSPEDHMVMDAALHDIRKRQDASLPTHAKPLESRNRQSSTPDTFSFDEDPQTEGVRADETVLHKLQHEDVLEYVDHDAVIQYFQEHESAFSQMIDTLNSKIHSDQYSEDEIAQFVRDKIELFVARDYLYPKSGVRDGGQPMVLWDRIAAIAQENGVTISDAASAQEQEAQPIQRPDSDNEKGFFARLKKASRYFYQP